MAGNPDAGSALPFVIDAPLPSGSLILEAKASWPRTTKIYCHPLDKWPEHAVVVEETLVRTCVRRGVVAYRFLGAARALADETTRFGRDGDP